MNRLAGLTFGLALGLGVVGQGPAQAGPFSHAAELGAGVHGARNVQYYGGQQPLPPAYFNQGGEAGRPPADFYGPGPRSYRTGPRYYDRGSRYYDTGPRYYAPAPRYYGPGPGYYGGEYYETPRRRGRNVRDPAGGGSLR
ncbi:MAG: hypothetical protein O9322_09650 [Beijerinckiaceae bacterium]|nr:hypothetical protein [Beijerinckiaceae bacterium]MCZ8299597.1 hypothetical protein [Beijerinckiaceae bacterium]